MKKKLSIATIILTFIFMALIIYLVFKGTLEPQSEVKKELNHALIEKLSK